MSEKQAAVEGSKQANRELLERLLDQLDEKDNRIRELEAENTKLRADINAMQEADGVIDALINHHR